MFEDCLTQIQTETDKVEKDEPAVAEKKEEVSVPVPKKEATEIK